MNTNTVEANQDVGLKEDSTNKHERIIKVNKNNSITIILNCEKQNKNSIESRRKNTLTIYDKFLKLKEENTIEPCLHCGRSDPIVVKCEIETCHNESADAISSNTNESNDSSNGRNVGNGEKRESTNKNMIIKKNSPKSPSLLDGENEDVKYICTINNNENNRRLTRSAYRKLITGQTDNLSPNKKKTNQ